MATTYDALSKLYPAISVDNLLDEGEDEEELNNKVKEIFKSLTYEKIKSDGPICNAKLSGKGKYLITQHLFALNVTEPEKVPLLLQSTARIVSLRISTKDTTSQFTQAWVDSVIVEMINS